MKAAIVFFLLVLTTNAFAENTTSGVLNGKSAEIEPVNKTVTDARVENTVENIYAEIKAGKMSRAELMFKAAKRGYANACLYAGYMFDNGIGVKRNPDKAFLWFQSCANKHPIVAYNLGVLYAEGRGTPKDMAMAVKYLKASWPSLKAQVPQISIRLAYYYYQQKSWNEAWEWAEKASSTSGNKKHGEYLMAKLIATGNSPSAGNISTALNKSESAMHAYNPKAAELTAWIYASGKTDETHEKAMEMACAYDNIAEMMGGKFQKGRYCGGLTEPVRKRAEDYARKWMANKSKPAPMIFTTTLDGKEKQFKL